MMLPTKYINEIQEGPFGSFGNPKATFIRKWKRKIRQLIKNKKKKRYGGVTPIPIHYKLNFFISNQKILNNFR